MLSLCVYYDLYGYISLEAVAPASAASASSMSYLISVFKLAQSSLYLLLIFVFSTCHKSNII